MNIALFTDSWYPTKSGVVTVVFQLRSILEELGHHVVIVTVSAGKNGEEAEQEDPLILRVPSVPSPLGDAQYMGLPSRKRVVEFLEEHKIELIHAHTEFSIGQMAVSAGKKMNIPVIATTHTMWEDYYRHYLSLGKVIPHRVIRKIVKLAYKHFYCLINVSEKARAYFSSFKMLPKTSCAVIPNAIDTSRFINHQISEKEKEEIRKSLNIKPEDRVMISVGRVVEEKRVIELLEIVARVLRQRDNAKMIFVGEGGALEFLKEKAREYELEDKIIFTGFIDWKKISSYYSISDFYVTVSLSEMHSMTLLEALSVGLPCVCRKDSSFADTIFHGENGFFANSDIEMDKYLLDLLDNPEKCKEMGVKAKEVSSRFTLRLHGLRTEAFYKKVIQKFPGKISSKELRDAVESVK